MSLTNLPEKYKSKLRENATKARTKVAMKKEFDKDCDADKYEVLQDYIMLSFYNYLSGFLTKNTLDDNPQEHVKQTEIEIRDIESHQYIYLEDKHKDIDIDEKWLDQQNEYVRQLSTEQMFNLFGYTHNGDVFINNHIRGTFDVKNFERYLEKFNIKKHSYFPLFFPALRMISRFGKKYINFIFKQQPIDEGVKQKTLRLFEKDLKNTEKYIILVDVMKYFSYELFWISVLEQYRDSIEEIIQGAPPTTKRMMLYRGVKTDYYLTEYMKDRNRIHVSKGFVSTSSSITVASDFADPDIANCCFMRIYVPIGTKMLLLSGLSRYMHEVEFLLGHKSQFFITKSSTEKFCTETHDLKMRVSNLVII